MKVAIEVKAVKEVDSTVAAEVARVVAVVKPAIATEGLMHYFP